MRPLMFTVVAAGALAASVALAQPAPGSGPDGAAPPPRDEMGERGGWMRRMMHRPPPPKAAFFNFRRGDSAMTVKCADDEPIKACTDAAIALLEAVRK